mgnify:CR=1 FL=1
MITIRDEKTGAINMLNTTYIKMIEFTRGSVRIIFKCGRQPDLTIKAKQITFDN